MTFPVDWFPDTSSMYRLLKGIGIRFYGSTSGYVGVKPPAVGDNTDYVLPATKPVANNYVMVCSAGGVMSWIAQQVLPRQYLWSEITATTVLLAAWNAYILNNVSRVVGTLPVNSSIGDQIRLAGKGAGGWQIAQNSGQTIHFGGQATTTGVGGSVTSTSTTDSVELVCITANSDWLVLSSLGNLTVV